MGLDLELLIPVAGNLDFEIRNKKFVITGMHDLYSENQRSKFFSVGEPYMDFEGNLNIDVKMKQYVLFKITEKFVLSITGNIQKPEIKLMKKNMLIKK